jgi:hypothetical protein
MKKILINRKGLKRLFILFLFIAVSGCVSYSLVRAGKDIEIGRVFKVESPINWSKLKESGIEIWTIDGPQLQRLYFFKGVEDGKPLIKMTGDKYKDMPFYKSSMTPLEVRELFEATLSRSGASRIEIQDLRPQKFASLEGFRFEFSYLTQNGLKYDGFVTGTQKGNKLLAIMYVGTALYHYGKHLEDVEKIVSSVVISSSFH